MYVLHVVETCVIGMISAGWHVTYAKELVWAFVEYAIMPGRRVSLFVISLVCIGTVAALANSWVLTSSCLDYAPPVFPFYLRVFAASAVFTPPKHRLLH